MTHRIGSLRTRVALYTVSAVAAIWLVAAFFTWYEARHELHELLAKLPAAARTVLEAEHEDIASDIAKGLLQPLLFALPVLAGLIALAVGIALAPLQQLAREVASRDPQRLDPFSETGAPTEILPLITRLNQLFTRVGQAIDSERRFTADAAHELRTPLAALKTQAQVALASSDTAERQHALNQILSGCDRATHLMTQMLMLARLDAPQGLPLERLELRALTAEVLAKAAGAAVERGSQLTLDDGAALEINGDRVLLGVLLRNLIDNALQHTPAGSQIDVEISLSARCPTLNVSDNGPGIDPDERSRVLERFHRAPGAGVGGSGLGLSIVQRIAVLHEAEFTLEQKVGAHGTVARIRFPSPRAA
jgi:signal transduction histidine kinase